MAELFQTNADHLAAEMEWLNALLRADAERWQERYHPPATDPFPGLYVSYAEVRRLLSEGMEPEPGPAGVQEAARLRAALNERIQASIRQGIPLALPRLAGMFGLTPLECEVCLLALAPELDLRYERVFAFLQDDLARRRPTIDLALRLFSGSARERISARSVFTPQAPLFRYNVCAPLEASAGPLLNRPLVLDELTLAFLFETGGLPAEMTQLLRPAPAAPPLATLRCPARRVEGLARVVREQAARRSVQAGRLVIHLHGPEGVGRKTLASALCADAAVPLLVGDLREIVSRGDRWEESLRTLFRQAVFFQSAVFLERFDCLLEEDGKSAAGLRTLERILNDLSWLTFLSTERPWAPGPLAQTMRFHSLSFTYPDGSERETLWRSFAAEMPHTEDGIDWDLLASRFRLTAGQIRGALSQGSSSAASRTAEGQVTTADLVESCHAQSNRRLAVLAHRMQPRKRWPDLTAPKDTLCQLQEICNQVRRRRRVYEEWGFEERLSLGKGLCALFHGPSGVGKTLAVEILALELGLEAYKVDLAGVVSKYIGETEKNLGRIFNEAETSNALLFFDEADALFGKRSEVKDAHDRYANIEINYLLQRIEEYDGLVILASNLRKNIDEAFFRRMHFAVEFPLPDAGDRYRIWKQHLPEAAPVSSEVDFNFLASRFQVPGGNIKNIVVNAAFLAARNGGEIRMEHFLRAARREFQKIGRVCTDSDFAPYQSLLQVS